MDGWLYLSRYCARISEESWKRREGTLYCWQFPSYSCHRPRTGLANLWDACSQWHAERFSWHAAFNDVAFFYFFTRPASLYWEEYVHMYTYLITYRLHKLPLLPNNTGSETFLQKSGAVRSGDCIFIVGAPA